MLFFSTPASPLSTASNDERESEGKASRKKRDDGDRKDGEGHATEIVLRGHR